MRVPNLFIAGAPRAGTTALHRRLSLHSELCMSNPKETNHYLFDGEPLDFSGPHDSVLNEQAVIDRVEYLDLFTICGSSQYAGESSPLYLYSREACIGINRDAPQAKIIILLRDPIERAHSHYLMLKRDFREDASSFREALRLEGARRRKGWAWSYRYRELSRYSKYVPMWFEHFGQENVLAMTTEELRIESVSAAKKILHFLGVPPEDPVSEFDRRVNLGGVPKLPSLHRFLTERHWFKGFLRKIGGGSLSGRVGAWARHKNLHRPDIDSDLLRELGEDLGSELSSMRPILGDRVSDWTTTATSVDR